MLTYWNRGLVRRHAVRNSSNRRTYSELGKQSRQVNKVNNAANKPRTRATEPNETNKPKRTEFAQRLRQAGRNDNLTSHKASPVRLPVTVQTNSSPINLSHTLSNPFLISARIARLCVTAIPRPARTAAQTAIGRTSSLVPPFSRACTCELSRFQQMGRGDEAWAIFVHGGLIWVWKRIVVSRVLSDPMSDMINYCNYVRAIFPNLLCTMYVTLCMPMAPVWGFWSEFLLVVLS